MILNMCYFSDLKITKAGMSLIVIFYFLHVTNIFADEFSKWECDYSGALESNNIDLLKPCFESDDSIIISNTIQALKYINKPEVKDILLNMWLGNKINRFNINENILNNARIRLSLATGLIDLGAEKRSDYINFIYGEINNPDVYTRASAAKGLGSVGDSHSVKSLVLLIENDYPQVAYNAINALEKIILSGTASAEAQQEIERLIMDNKIKDVVLRNRLDDVRQTIIWLKKNKSNNDVIKSE